MTQEKRYIVRVIAPDGWGLIDREATLENLDGVLAYVRSAIEEHVEADPPLREHP